MTTTIQQTSKPIKLTIFIGFALFWVSLIVLFASEEMSTKDSAVWFMIIGALTWFMGRVMRWWKHA